LRNLRRGVTLIEMLLVMAIIGLMAAISFPAVNSGLDSIRLHSASDSVASFLDAAMNRADGRQQVVEILIDPQQNRLAAYSTQAGYTRTLQMPQGVTIAGDDQRRYLVLPGGAFPRLAVDLVNTRGAHKHIVVDPITGSPHIS
jgi:prepilin-type N-terminal cleavage/methylation domain-containing protein